jgi:hypothetical protein
MDHLFTAARYSKAELAVFCDEKNGGVGSLLIRIVIRKGYGPSFFGADPDCCPSSYKLEHQGADPREDLAHLVQDIKRRICGIASAGTPSFSP